MEVVLFLRIRDKRIEATELIPCPLSLERMTLAPEKIIDILFKINYTLINSKKTEEK